MTSWKTCSKCKKGTLDIGFEKVEGGEWCPSCAKKRKAEEETIANKHRQYQSDRHDNLMKNWNKNLGSEHFFPSLRGDINSEKNNEIEQMNDKIEEELEFFEKEKDKCEKEPEYRLNYYLNILEKTLCRSDSSGPQSRSNVYVLRVKPQEEWPDEDIAIAEYSRKFPSEKYPELDAGMPPRGCVYVGVTGLEPEERWQRQTDQNHEKFTPSKIAKLGLLSSYSSFEECGKDLTEKYGLKGISHYDHMTQRQKQLKSESWVAWALYKAGYWVWGPHHHIDEPNFLGSYPFL